MDSHHELRRLSQHLPALPAEVSDRIAGALAAEAARRVAAQSRQFSLPMALPPQRGVAGQAIASYVPRQARVSAPG
jgi:hypothetical protein